MSGEHPSPSTVDYAQENALLFSRRGEVLSTIETLRARRRLTPTAKRQLLRAERELDDLETSIVSLNRGLVISYARRFTKRGRSQDMADFEAAGTAGLVAAMKSYDPSKGPFAQWAYHPIQRAVTRAVRDADHPNMNPGDFERRPDIIRARERLLKEGLNPTAEEIAAEAGTTTGQVHRVLEAPRLVSCDLPVGDDGESTVGELVADQSDEIPDIVATEMMVAALERHGFDVLDLREVYVITKHFGLDGGEPQKLATIGQTLGLSREAARQIESKALAKLAHPNVLAKLVRQRD